MDRSAGDIGSEWQPEHLDPIGSDFEPERAEQSDEELAEGAPPPEERDEQDSDADTR